MKGSFLWLACFTVVCLSDWCSVCGYYDDNGLSQRWCPLIRAQHCMKVTPPDAATFMFSPGIAALVSCGCQWHDINRRGTSHLSGVRVLAFFCWDMFLNEKLWIKFGFHMEGESVRCERQEWVRSVGGRNKKVWWEPSMLGWLLWCSAARYIWSQRISPALHWNWAVV